MMRPARTHLALAAAVVALAVLAGGCGALSSGASGTGSGGPGTTGASPGIGGSPGPGASPRSSPTSSPARSALPLAGKVVGIDPGHNGGNFTHPSYINRIIWNGTGHETCDTTGTQTAGGYTEARFNFNVASYLRADLIRDGARVVMTRTSNRGVGPLLIRPSFQRELARAFTAAIVKFLTARQAD